MGGEHNITVHPDIRITDTLAVNDSLRQLGWTSHVADGIYSAIFPGPTRHDHGLLPRQSPLCEEMGHYNYTLCSLISEVQNYKFIRKPPP